MSHNKKSSSINSNIHIINPTLIYFTHSRIRPYFTGCNKRIEETLQDIIDGTISIDIIPLITVIENNGYYFSLNNRRLYLIKELYQLDLLNYKNNNIPKNMIQVYMKPALEREKLRYTINRCSLTAKIMKEHHSNINQIDLSKDINSEEYVDHYSNNNNMLSDSNDNQSSNIDNIHQENNIAINDNRAINKSNNNDISCDQMNKTKRNNNNNNNSTNNNNNNNNTTTTTTNNSTNNNNNNNNSNTTSNSNNNNNNNTSNINNTNNSSTKNNNQGGKVINDNSIQQTQILIINNKIILKEINKSFSKLILKSKIQKIISILDDWLELKLINNEELLRICDYYNIKSLYKIK